MGLDVRVFSNVKEATIDNYNFVANVLDDKWVDRIKNLKRGQYYTGDSSDWLISYPCRTHNDFRRQLSLMLGFEADRWLDRDMSEDTPFYEFFEFADNEGCMDWETARKLRYDFLNLMPEAVEKLPTDYLGYYKDWLTIFTQADKEQSVIVYS